MNGNLVEHVGRLSPSRLSQRLSLKTSAAPNNESLKQASQVEGLARSLVQTELDSTKTDNIPAALEAQAAARAKVDAWMTEMSAFDSVVNERLEMEDQIREAVERARVEAEKLQMRARDAEKDLIAKSPQCSPIKSAPKTSGATVIERGMGSDVTASATEPSGIAYDDLIFKLKTGGAKTEAESGLEAVAAVPISRPAASPPSPSGTVPDSVRRSGCADEDEDTAKVQQSNEIQQGKEDLSSPAGDTDDPLAAICEMRAAAKAWVDSGSPSTTPTGSPQVAESRKPSENEVGELKAPSLPASPPLVASRKSYNSTPPLRARKSVQSSQAPSTVHELDTLRVTALSSSPPQIASRKTDLEEVKARHLEKIEALETELKSLQVKFEVATSDDDLEYLEEESERILVLTLQAHEQLQAFQEMQPEVALLYEESLSSEASAPLEVSEPALIPTIIAIPESDDAPTDEEMKGPVTFHSSTRTGTKVREEMRVVRLGEIEKKSSSPSSVDGDNEVEAHLAADAWYKSWQERKAQTLTKALSVPVSSKEQKDAAAAKLQSRSAPISGKMEAESNCGHAVLDDAAAMQAAEAWYGSWKDPSAADNWYRSWKLRKSRGGVKAQVLTKAMSLPVSSKEKKDAAVAKLQSRSASSLGNCGHAVLDDAAAMQAAEAWYGSWKDPSAADNWYRSWKLRKSGGSAKAQTLATAMSLPASLTQDASPRALAAAPGPRAFGASRSLSISSMGQSDAPALGATPNANLSGQPTGSVEVTFKVPTEVHRPASENARQPLSTNLAANATSPTPPSGMAADPLVNSVAASSEVSDAHALTPATISAMPAAGLIAAFKPKLMPPVAEAIEAEDGDPTAAIDATRRAALLHEKTIRAHMAQRKSELAKESKALDLLHAEMNKARKPSDAVQAVDKKLSEAVKDLWYLERDFKAAETEYHMRKEMFERKRETMEHLAKRRATLKLEAEAEKAEKLQSIMAKLESNTAVHKTMPGSSFIGLMLKDH